MGNECFKAGQEQEDELHEAESSKQHLLPPDESPDNAGDDPRAEPRRSSHVDDAGAEPDASDAVPELHKTLGGRPLTSSHHEKLQNPQDNKWNDPKDMKRNIHPRSRWKTVRTAIRATSTKASSPKTMTAEDLLSDTNYVPVYENKNDISELGEEKESWGKLDEFELATEQPFSAIAEADRNSQTDTNLTGFKSLQQDEPGSPPTDKPDNKDTPDRFQMTVSKPQIYYKPDKQESNDKPRAKSHSPATKKKRAKAAWKRAVIYTRAKTSTTPELKDEAATFSSQPQILFGHSNRDEREDSSIFSDAVSAASPSSQEDTTPGHLRDINKSSTSYAGTRRTRAKRNKVTRNKPVIYSTAKPSMTDNSMNQVIVQNTTPQILFAESDESQEDNSNYEGPQIAQIPPTLILDTDGYYNPTSGKSQVNPNQISSDENPYSSDEGSIGPLYTARTHQENSPQIDTEQTAPDEALSDNPIEFQPPSDDDFQSALSSEEGSLFAEDPSLRARLSRKHLSELESENEDTLTENQSELTFANLDVFQSALALSSDEGSLFAEDPALRERLSLHTKPEHIKQLEVPKSKSTDESAESTLTANQSPTPIPSNLSADYQSALSSDEGSLFAEDPDLRARLSVRKTEPPQNQKQTSEEQPESESTRTEPEKPGPAHSEPEKPPVQKVKSPTQNSPQRKIEHKKEKPPIKIKESSGWKMLKDSMNKLKFLTPAKLMAAKRGRIPDKSDSDTLIVSEDSRESALGPDSVWLSEKERLAQLTDKIKRRTSEQSRINAFNNLELTPSTSAKPKKFESLKQEQINSTTTNIIPGQSVSQRGPQTYMYENTAPQNLHHHHEIQTKQPELQQKTALPTAGQISGNNQKNATIDPDLVPREQGQQNGTTLPLQEHTTHNKVIPVRASYPVITPSEVRDLELKSSNSKERDDEDDVISKYEKQRNPQSAEALSETKSKRSTLKKISKLSDQLVHGDLSAHKKSRKSAIDADGSAVMKSTSEKLRQRGRASNDSIINDDESSSSEEEITTTKLIKTYPNGEKVERVINVERNRITKERYRRLLRKQQALGVFMKGKPFGIKPVTPTQPKY